MKFYSVGRKTGEVLIITLVVLDPDVPNATVQSEGQREYVVIVAAVSNDERAVGLV